MSQLVCLSQMQSWIAPEYVNGKSMTQKSRVELIILDKTRGLERGI